MLAAALRYFAGVFVAGFVLGTLRTLALAQIPDLDAVTAVLLELPLILAFSAWLALRLLRSARLTAASAQLGMGLLALILLLVAEAALSLLLAGRSWSEHFALYAEPAHQLGLAGQCLFALWPLLLGNRAIRRAAL